MAGQPNNPEAFPQETPKATEEAKHVISTKDGGVVELTDSQLKKAAAYGLNTLVDLEAAKETPSKPVETPVQKPSESDAAFIKRLEALENREKLKEEAKQTRKRDEQTIGALKTKIAQEGLEDLSNTIVAAVIGEYSIQKRDAEPGEAIDVEKILATKIAEFKAIRPGKVDPTKKLDAIDKTGALTASSKGGVPGEKPEKLGRKSFRDGTLVNRALARMKKLAKEEE